MTVEGPWSFGVGFFFLRKKKNNEKKVRRLKEKNTLLIWGSGDMAPRICPAWPPRLHLPSLPCQVGHWGNWKLGCQQFAQQGPLNPASRTSVNGPLVAVTGRGVWGWGQRSPLALLLWGKVAQMGCAISPPQVADGVDGRGPARCQPHLAVRAAELPLWPW